MDTYKTENDEQITLDGEVRVIFNGIPDWVYEEEILKTNSAMYFNPSGSKMAFAKFNDTLVEEYIYTKYGDPWEPLSAQVCS